MTRSRELWNLPKYSEDDVVVFEGEFYRLEGVEYYKGSFGYAFLRHLYNADRLAMSAFGSQFHSGGNKVYKAMRYFCSKEESYRIFKDSPLLFPTSTRTIDQRLEVIENELIQQRIILGNIAQLAEAALSKGV